MKLCFTVLRFNEARLETTIEDATGRHRRVEIKWFAKDNVNHAPVDWPQQVRKELELQDSIKLRAQRGGPF